MLTEITTRKYAITLEDKQKAVFTYKLVSEEEAEECFHVRETTTLTPETPKEERKMWRTWLMWNAPNG